MEASSDPVTATAQTVAIMCEHIARGAADPLVRQTARRALDQFAGLSGFTSEPASIGAAAFWWCKHYLKFVHHELILRERLGEAGHLQGLISPEVLVRMERPEGDCAIYTDCVCAFLRVFGVPCEIVTVAVNPEEPSVFSHVYLYVVLPSGERLPIDASHGDYPGWQVPSARVSRRQVWDLSGNPIEDRGSRFTGLGNYGMRGMAADGDYGGEFSIGAPDPSTTPTDPYLMPGGVSYDLGPGYFGSDPSAGSYVAPSQNSAQWAAFASNLAKQGFTLAQINAIQPGTVVSANGAILRQNPGYAVPVPGTASISASLGGGSNLLLIGGGLLVAVLLMSSMGRK